MTKLPGPLKSLLQKQVEIARIYWLQNVQPSIEDTNAEFSFILQQVKKNKIKFKPKANQEDNVNAVCEGNGEDVVSKKKRGRRHKASTVAQDHRVTRSESCDSDDSVSSTMSSRSRRAAAQAAGQKLAKVQSFMKATKLRRPTDFDEKQVKQLLHKNTTSSPPTKCRKTDQVSAGRRSFESPDKDVEVEKNNTSFNSLTKECSVVMSKMSTPEIQPLINKTKSWSLERISHKRKSDDLFNDSAPLSEMKTENKKKEKCIHKEGALDADIKLTVNVKKTELRKDKGIANGTGLNKEEIHEIEQLNLPMAHSSPISLRSSLTFQGFYDEHHDGTFTVQNKNKKFQHDTFVKAEDIKSNPEVYEVVQCEEKEKCVMKKIIDRSDEENHTEITEIKTNSIRSKTKILRKRASHQTEKKEIVGEEQEKHQDHTNIVISPVQGESPNIHSKTKVIKNPALVQEEGKKTGSEGSQFNSDQENDVKAPSEGDTPEIGVRTRTRTLRKKAYNESPEEENNIRSRTKTIKKHETNEVIENLSSKYLASEFKENAVLLNKLDKESCMASSHSPGVNKGELVKKRVEDFEKLKNQKEVEEETVGVFTRNAAKNKAISSSLVTPNLKKNQNILPNKMLSSVSNAPCTGAVRSTALGTNNRMTPGFSSNPRIPVSKLVNSATRKLPVETSLALVQKQTSEEAERKKKEEERMRREAKEKEAMIKKEKALKAAAETKRKKREEKNQKVAAAREAAEKEKALLAVKAEKEKEEKMRQKDANEKERQKEEQQKKKLLQQQKNQEHEERRKCEEAARLAKIKEQEEEYKRVLAMKEREQEILKHRKMSELKLAEAEKCKTQHTKLAITAAINSAKIPTQVVTPLVKANGCQQKQVPAQSYEITPAREERPQLKPKTDNDYGIDDANTSDSSDDESNPKKNIPEWAQNKNRDYLLKINSYLPKKLWELFMEANSKPDVNQIFVGIPVKKRVRTSSAVWNTPPQL